MYPSPNMSLMSLFMDGSSNLHPAPDLQLNAAGPLISSFKKSEMSVACCKSLYSIDRTLHSPTLPSSPQMNRPGMHEHLIRSQEYTVEFAS